MILVDTSAWVGFLRAVDHPVVERLDRLLDRGEALASCDAVRMELLAGARDEAHLHSLRRLLAATTCPITATRHFDDAAQLYRLARTRGVTVRSVVDCLIATIAIDLDVPVLHLDRDFTYLARCSPLRVDLDTA